MRKRRPIIVLNFTFANVLLLGVRIPKRWQMMSEFRGGKLKHKFFAQIKTNPGHLQRLSKRLHKARVFWPFVTYFTGHCPLMSVNIAITMQGCD